MPSLLRFTLLLLCITLIPWLASNPPPWRLLTDSGWVQAWGSIGAILVGFAYVALQNHWQAEERRRRQKEQRLFLHGVAKVALAAADDALGHFQRAHEQGSKVIKSAGPDPLQKIAEELATPSPESCGSVDFAWACRQAAAFGHEFSSTTQAIVEMLRSPTGSDLERLKSCRAAINDAAERMKAAI